MPLPRTLQPGYYGKASAVVSQKSEDYVDDEPKGEIHRLAIASDALMTHPRTDPSIATLYDVVQYIKRKHGDHDALGWRDVLEVQEVGKTKKWRLADYQYITYTQFVDRIDQIASGLIELGVQAGDVWNVYSKTSVNWQSIGLALASISIPMSTAYETLGEDGLRHSIQEPGCSGVFTNAELLPMLLKVLRKFEIQVRYIVYDGAPANDQLPGVRILHVDELLSLGASHDRTAEANTRRPKPNDLSCIMYTSGSTGLPKGVMISHSNMVASVAAVDVLLGPHLPPSYTTSPPDRYLAYLPLAHVLEYIVELSMLFCGVLIGYGSPKTLTDTFMLEGSIGDLRSFEPSILVGVPAVWEMIRKGVNAKVNQGGFLTRAVFNTAFYLKSIPLGSYVGDAVFNKMKGRMGLSKLTIGMCGGASLSRDTQEWLKTVLVETMLQGYGMTESCGMCVILPPELRESTGSVGAPVPSIEVMLDAETAKKEGGYEFEAGQGEVLIRGPSITKGYYNRPDLTKEVFLPGGWLRTGDVGKWVGKDVKTLAVVDRIKNLVKLRSGEYVALEKMESVFKACSVVGNICVLANSDLRSPVAIVIPHEPNLRHALSSSGTGVDASLPLAKLCDDERVRKLVLDACNDTGAQAATGLTKDEKRLGGIVLTPDEWTPETGLVTAAMKIQRKKITERFGQEIEEIVARQ